MDSSPPPLNSSERPEVLLERMREALRVSEVRFQAFMRLCPTLCWMTDPQGVMIYVNDAWCRSTGVRTEEAVGRKLREIFPMEVAEELLSNNLAALSRDECVETTERVPSRDGIVREYLIYKFPVPDGQGGRLVGGMGVDVTERQAEERMVRRAQKLETVALMADGLAHNFSQVLALIRGHAELLQERDDLSEAARHSVNRIASAAAGAAQLTRQLLAFSRRQATVAVLYDAGAVVRRMAGLVEPLLGRGVELGVTVLDEPLVVEGDPSALEQILLNLAMNARDALGERGRLEFRAGPWGRGRERRVRIEVIDTGCGIPPENLERVWEPFFTTKDDAGGSGLGLATVYGLVQQNGGRVWVRSTPGHGTTFSIELPRVD